MSRTDRIKRLAEAAGLAVVAGGITGLLIGSVIGAARDGAALGAAAGIAAVCWLEWRA